LLSIQIVMNENLGKKGVAQLQTNSDISLMPGACVSIELLG